MSFNARNAGTPSNSLFLLLTRTGISPALLAAKKRFASSFRPFPAGHPHPKKGLDRPHAQRLQEAFLEPEAQQPGAVFQGFLVR
jgi:hypothetical protein